MTAKGHCTDFSSWDVSIEFSGEQAAALVIGLNPASEGYTRTQSTPIYERMQHCYELKMAWLWGEMGPSDDGLIASPKMLESTNLTWWFSQVEPGSWNDFCLWSKDESRSGFATQRFAREELIRWLKAVGVESTYSFDLTPSFNDPLPTFETPTAVPGNTKRWTPQALEELQLYRDNHGTKAAGEKFKISGARIRKMLPKEKPKFKVNNMFNQLKK